MPVSTVWTNPTSAGMDINNNQPWTETVVDNYASDLYRLGGSDGNSKTGRLQIAEATTFEANANMTTGLQIQQGTADDEALLVRSSTDVSHGMTSEVVTDGYARIQKVAAAAGGARLTGFTDDTRALLLEGYGVTDDTTKGTAGNAYAEIAAAKRSGTTVGQAGANANLLAVKDYNVTRAIIDAEGDLHLDAASLPNAWDAHDDLALLEAYRITTAAPPNYRRRFARDVEACARVLHETGVITLGAGGHHFVSVKGFFGLVIDALRQEGTRLRALEARVSPLLERPGALQGRRAPRP